MTIEEYNSIKPTETAVESTSTVIPALVGSQRMPNFDKLILAPSPQLTMYMHATEMMLQRRCQQSGSWLPGLRMFNNIVFEQATRWSTCSTGATCIHSNRSRVDATFVSQRLSWHPNRSGRSMQMEATPCFNRSATNSSGTRTGCGPTTSRSKCPTWTWNQHNRRRGSYSNAWSMVEHRCSIISQHPPGMLWWRCCNRCTAPASPAASTQATSWSKEPKQLRGSEATATWQHGSSNSGQKRWSTTISKRSMCGASTICHSPCPRMRSNSCCVRIAQQPMMINRWKDEKSSNRWDWHLNQQSLDLQQIPAQQEVQTWEPGMRKIRWVFDQHLRLGNRCKTTSHQPCTEINT